MLIPIPNTDLFIPLDQSISEEEIYFYQEHFFKALEKVSTEINNGIPIPEKEYLAITEKLASIARDNPLILYKQISLESLLQTSRLDYLVNNWRQSQKAD